MAASRSEPNRGRRHYRLLVSFLIVLWPTTVVKRLDGGLQIGRGPRAGAHARTLQDRRWGRLVSGGTRWSASTPVVDVRPVSRQTAHPPLEGTACYDDVEVGHLQHQVRPLPLPVAGRTFVFLAGRPGGRGLPRLVSTVISDRRDELYAPDRYSGVVKEVPAASGAAGRVLWVIWVTANGGQDAVNDDGHGLGGGFSDWGLYDFTAAGTVIRVSDPAAELDQLHAMTLTPCELLGRRLLLIEQVSVYDSGNPDYSNSDDFFGGGVLCGAPVVPPVKKRAGHNARDPAPVLSEGRKLDGEIRIRQPKGAKGGGRGGDGGQDDAGAGASGATGG